MKFRETLTDFEKMVGLSLDEGIDFHYKNSVGKMSL